jgi:hypothetical protein
MQRSLLPASGWPDTLRKRLRTARPYYSSMVRARQATILVLTLGILLRLGLAVVNLEANDNHIEVVRIIAQENRIPDRTEALEAFQPKLYHATVAVIWKIMPAYPLPFLIRIAQLVSCMAGIVTLLVALRFLARLNISEKVRFLSVSLMALNPKLIGINAQATNDSFVILFATLTLYFGFLYFGQGGVKNFSWMTIFAGLAGLSKGNGLVVVVAIMAVFVTAFLRSEAMDFMERRKLAVYGAAFFIGVMGVVSVFGPYTEHYRRYGSPFVINMPRPPFPHLLEKSFAVRPGVTSVIDSFLTFRFFDMMRNPVISEHPTNYPLHRTSLWSQLYGRAHFVHFDQHPASWESRHPFVLNLGRAIFIFALFPTYCVVVGMCRRVVLGIEGIRKGGMNIQAPLGHFLMSLAVLGYIGLVVVFSTQYRDFATMKAIYIFPGLVAFLTLFAEQCERFYSWCDKKNHLRLCADVGFVMLLLLYQADVAMLIYQLR